MPVKTARGRSLEFRLARCGAGVDRLELP